MKFLLKVNISRLSPVLFVGISALLASAIVLLNQLILAKWLTADQFGAFMSELSLLNVLAPLAGFGVYGYLLRFTKSHGSSTKSLYDGSFLVSLLSSLAICALFVSLAYFTIRESKIVHLVIFSACILQQAMLSLGVAVAQAKDDFLKIGFFQLFGQFGRFLAIVLSFVILHSGFEVMVGYGVSAIAVTASLVMYIYLNRLKYPRKVKLTMSRSCALVGRSKFYALNNFFNILILQGGVYIVAVFGSAYLSGQYSLVSSMIVFGSVFSSAVVNQYLLGGIIKAAKVGEDELYLNYRRTHTFLLILGFVATFVVYVFSAYVIVYLFGNKYKEAVFLVEYAAIVIFFRTLITGMGGVLVATDSTSEKLYVMIGVSIFQIAVFSVSVIQLGILGVGISMVVCEVVLYISYGVLLKYRVFRGKSVYQVFFPVGNRGISS